jgi:hypothetical protein
MPDKPADSAPRTWRTRCPHCAKPLRFERFPTRVFEKTFDCPYCQTELGITVFAKVAKTSPGDTTPDTHAPRTVPFTPTGAPPPVKKRATEQSREASPGLELVDDDDDDDEEYDGPKPAYYDPKSNPATVSRRPSRPLLSLRATRRLVSFTLWWGPFCFFMCGGTLVPNSLSAPFILGGAFSIIWVIVCSFFIFRLSRLITAGLVSRFCCPGCQETIACTGIWNTGQYRDHRQRHILLARDPFSGAWVGHTNCPFCHVSIFV